MKEKKGRIFVPVMVAVLTTCFFWASISLARLVPDTGQTICYNELGNVIECPLSDEDFYGQDASYTINPPSYTKLDAAGNNLPAEAGSWAMVRDNVTGLIWEIKQNLDDVKNYDNPHDADNTYTWYDSNPITNFGNAGTPGNGVTAFDTEQFINTLNAGHFGGISNWRLPTIKEIANLVNSSIGSPGPCIDVSFFPNTASFVPSADSSFYWSSTTFAASIGSAWQMDFATGHGSTAGKNSSQFVYAVSGIHSDLLDRWVDNADGTITNSATGLMWQQATAPKRYDWGESLAYAEDLTLAGYSDWRLPTIKELRSLVNYYSNNPAAIVSLFPDTVPSIYWSSTTNTTTIYGTSVAWGINFYGGHDNSPYKWLIQYARAVRGGQAQSSDQIMVLSPLQASIWTIDDIMHIIWQASDSNANVTISISRLGGAAGSFENIIANHPNNGQYDWPVTGPASVNCEIRIEQVDDPNIWATQGLFVIQDAGNPCDFNNDGKVDIVDIMSVATRWGTKLGDENYDAAYDLNQDGKIDIIDIMMVAAQWGWTE